MKSYTSNREGNPHQYCEYRTRRLNLSAWLHAEGLLEYLRCEFNPRIGKAEWFFDDPRQMGRELEDQFDSGAGATSATKLFNSLHAMRRELSSNNKPANGDNYGQPESHR